MVSATRASSDLVAAQQTINRALEVGLWNGEPTLAVMRRLSWYVRTFCGYKSRIWPPERSLIAQVLSAAVDAAQSGAIAHESAQAESLRELTRKQRERRWQISWPKCDTGEERDPVKWARGQR